MKKTKNTTVVNSVVKESIKDQTVSRKLSIKTIFFSILAVGVVLMAIAYLYSYLRMGQMKDIYGFGKANSRDSVTVVKNDSLFGDGE